MFFIHPKDGRIGVVARNSNLNFEKISSYGITIRATDNEGLYAEISTHVLVIDENEKPRIAPHHYIRYIVENSAIGSTPVIATDGVTHSDANNTKDQFCTIDEDSGAEGEMNVTLMDESNLFELNATYQTSCYVFSLINDELNFESDALKFKGGYYTMEILVEDGGEPSLTASLHAEVFIVDENEAPSFPKLSEGVDGTISLNIYSETEVGEEVGPMLFAQDEDNGDEIKYKVSGGSNEFILKNSSVSGGGAVLVVNQALSASKIQLIVTATDMDGLEDTITLNITIMNSNRPPNVTSALFYVAEDIAPGSSIATLNGNDPDLDNFAYSIAAGDVDSLFNINEVTGTITYQENSISSNGLNFERVSDYTLVVQAVDDSTNLLKHMQ